jgi:MFS family permease
MTTGLALIAVADAALIPGAAHGWALATCVAAAGAGLGLSSVAATTLGTAVVGTWRGTASGIINTAAQLGTAAGVAAVLLIAAATTGLPGPGTGAPSIGWAAAASIAAAGALAFTRSPRPGSAATRTAGAEPAGEPAARQTRPAGAACSAARARLGNRSVPLPQGHCPKAGRTAANHPPRLR